MLHICLTCNELSFNRYVWTSDPPCGTQVWVLYDKVKTGCHVLNIRVFPKVDDSGNVARIVLGLKFCNFKTFGKDLVKIWYMMVKF